MAVTSIRGYSKRRVSKFRSPDRLTGLFPSRNLESPQERSARMSAVRHHGTAPELVVRRLLKERNVRFRTDVRTLPGRPDLANQTRGFAIFVHGCFWHRHPDCPRATMPASNVEFWAAKFQRTVARDRAAVRELRRRGFAVLVIWECETKHEIDLAQKISMFLSRSEP
jgi:DNA mismatch endonuclease (patch repair protein)